MLWIYPVVLGPPAAKAVINISPTALSQELSGKPADCVCEGSAWIHSSFLSVDTELCLCLTLLIALLCRTLVHRHGESSSAAAPLLPGCFGRGGGGGISWALRSGSPAACLLLLGRVGGSPCAECSPPVWVPAQWMQGFLHLPYGSVFEIQDTLSRWFLCFT